jgi:hypothetical protein
MIYFEFTQNPCTLLTIVVASVSFYYYCIFYVYMLLLASTIIASITFIMDRLCGLVVRVSGYRYKGLGFDPRRYQIFWVVVGPERGPLSLVRSTEELFELKK